MSNIQQNTACSGKNSAEQLEVAIVGAGFAGMYMLYRLRRLGLSSRVYETGSGVGVHGIGIVIPAHAVTSKVCSTPINFLTSYNRNGSGVRSIQRSQKFSATRIT